MFLANIDKHFLITVSFSEIIRSMFFKYFFLKYLNESTAYRSIIRPKENYSPNKENKIMHEQIFEKGHNSVRKKTNKKSSFKAQLRTMVDTPRRFQEQQFQEFAI